MKKIRFTDVFDRQHPLDAVGKLQKLRNELHREIVAAKVNPTELIDMARRIGVLIHEVNHALKYNGVLDVVPIDQDIAELIVQNMRPPGPHQLNANSVAWTTGPANPPAKMSGFGVSVAAMWGAGMTNKSKELPHTEQEEPITAYRAWRVVYLGAAGYALRSLNVRKIWDGPVLRADGPPTKWEDNAWLESLEIPGNPYDGYKEVPERKYHFGIFAFDSPLRALIEGAARALEHVSGPGACGQISLMGRVIEHERGYRAEYARVENLTVIYARPEDQSEQLEKDLAERYHCDVEVINGHR